MGSERRHRPPLQRVGMPRNHVDVSVHNVVSDIVFPALEPMLDDGMRGMVWVDVRSPTRLPAGEVILEMHPLYALVLRRVARQECLEAHVVIAELPDRFCLASSVFDLRKGLLAGFDLLP